MSPEERVLAFTKAMFEWERKVFRGFEKSTREDNQQAAKELRAIYDDHLSEKGKGLKEFGRKIHPKYGTPVSVSDGQYAQALLRVDRGPRKSPVYVITTGARDFTAYRYKVVIDAEGVPWIDEMRACVVVKGNPTEDWTLRRY